MSNFTCAECNTSLGDLKIRHLIQSHILIIHERVFVKFRSQNITRVPRSRLA